MDVRAVHPLRQPGTRRRCLSTSGCSDLCLPRPDGHTCACPSGLRLEPGRSVRVGLCPAREVIRAPAPADCAWSPAGQWGSVSAPPRRSHVRLPQRTAAGARQVSEGRSLPRPDGHTCACPSGLRLEPGRSVRVGLCPAPTVTRAPAPADCGWSPAGQ